MKISRNKVTIRKIKITKMKNVDGKADEYTNYHKQGVHYGKYTGFLKNYIRATKKQI